jgi:hypothetical protein
MSEVEETGAIDWFLVEFHGKELDGSLIPPLLDLVDRRLVRILDVLIIKKRQGEDFDLITSQDLDPAQVGPVGELAGASSGLLSDDDAASAAAILDDDTAGLIVVYENLWSLRYAAALRAAGAQLVAQGHIPTQAILAKLDELDAAEA